MKKLKTPFLFFSIVVFIMAVNGCENSEKLKQLPILTTSPISNVTQNTASGGGLITYDGGSDVVSRGVCWSLNPNPTITNNISKDAAGTGEFLSSLVNLIADTTYYVRAYATNDSGTAYGLQVSFKTLKSTLPILTTNIVTDITYTSAKSGGNVTNNGGSPILSKGVCWSKSIIPTIDGDKTIDGNGLGEFESSAINLINNTRYYLRAYATNIAGTAYGNLIEFKTNSYITGVTLNKSTLSVTAGETATLVATILPVGVEGTINWISSNPAVAKVVDGAVIGVTEGNANIVAVVDSYTATCAVTVTKVVVDFTQSLKGTEYYPFILDGATSVALGSKIKADLRPDDNTKFLIIWDKTFSARTTTGSNFYGEIEGWVSLVVGTAGWSGAGFLCKDAALLNKLAAITANTNGYYLHIGIKSKSNQTFVFALDGQSNTKFAIGATAFNDNGTLIQPLADFTRDGEWQEIEIPLSTLKTNGLLYSVGMGEKNLLWFLAGGVTGTTLDLDAIFIYKK